jgi:hypothetical protein
MITHVVISRYNEDIKWVTNLKYPFTIFNKGLNNISLPYVKLQNIGRESGTYIHYIIENYNKLPDYIILLQGNPFEHCRNLFERINNFEKDNIVLLADGVLINNLSVVPDDHREGINIIVNKLNIHSYLNNFEKPQYSYPFGSQWIIPKKYIINKSKQFWIDLYEVHQKVIVSAWVLERMFLHIFYYSDIN